MEGPTAHWIEPEMLVDLMIEGRNVKALADSGSQVNTITPAFIQQCGFPVLPLVDLVNHPLNLVGLGRKCTSLLRFVILHVQVGISLGMMRMLGFSWYPTIGRIINVIQESEIDCLSMA